MKIITVDTETTGVDATDQVVEVAILELDGGQWESLVRPTVPVSYGARAAHHITDEELAKAPTMKKLMANKAFRKTLDANIFAAHNAAFDRAMLIQSGVPEAWLPPETICTWRCAMRLWPDAPAYGNQVLRYYLGLKVKLPIGGVPHRALYDTLVTEALLRHMLTYNAPSVLVELTKAPILLKTIRFGMHRGKLWSDIDAGYLRFLIRPDKSFDGDVVYTAKHWLARK